MSMTLLSKRNGQFHLPPAKKGDEPRIWAGNTTIVVDDAEGQALLKYKDVVQLKNGQQIKGPEGAKPVPAGAGVSGTVKPKDGDAKK